MGHRGFSLIGVMVGAGIMGVVAAAFAHLLNSTMSLQSYILDTEEATAHGQTVHIALMSPVNCMETMVTQAGGLTAPGYHETVTGLSQIFVHDASASPVVFTARDSAINNRLTLESLSLYGAYPPNPPDAAGDYLQVVELILQYERSGLGRKNVVRKVPVAMKISSAGAIIACSSNIGDPNALNDPSRDPASEPTGPADGSCTQDNEWVKGSTIPFGKSTAAGPPHTWAPNGFDTFTYSTTIYPEGSVVSSDGPGYYRKTDLCVNGSWVNLEFTDTTPSSDGFGGGM